MKYDSKHNPFVFFNVSCLHNLIERVEGHEWGKGFRIYLVRKIILYIVISDIKSELFDLNFRTLVLENFQR